MDEIKTALHGLLIKAITAAGSTKIWMTLLGMALSCYMGYRYGGVEGLVLAVAGSLGLPLTYTVVKGYQNTHGVNAPAVIGGASTQVVITPAGTTVSTPGPAATATAQPAQEEPPRNLVKEALDINLALVVPDAGVFSYLGGVMGEQLKRFIQQCADDNLTTPEAIQALAEKYFGVKLTLVACSEIQSTVGLPAVLSEMHDKNILDSFETAYYAHTLGDAMMAALRNAARYYAALDIVNAYSKAVIYAPDIASRSLALQQFGIPKAQADQTQTNGPDIYYKDKNGQYIMFNGAALIGLVTETMQPY